jgi:hypothetical protein
MELGAILKCDNVVAVLFMKEQLPRICFVAALAWLCTVPLNAQQTLFLAHYDNSLNADYAAVAENPRDTGGVSLCTTESKWGGGSLLVSEMDLEHPVTLSYDANEASDSTGTLEMWVKPKGWTWRKGGGAWAENRTMVLGSVQNRSPESNGDGITLGYGGNNPIAGGATMTQTGEYAMANACTMNGIDQEWRHLAVVWSPKRLAFYCDGALEYEVENEKVAGRTMAPFTQLVIGNSNIASGKNNGDAYIDDVRLSDYEVYTGTEYPVPEGPLQVVKPL